MFQFERAAQRDPDPQQRNKISEVEGAAQIVPEQEQPNNGFPEREPMRVTYRSFLNTRRRIAVIKG